MRRILVLVVAGLLTASSAAPMAVHAASSGGLAFAWGDNEFGQLGNGGTTNALTPVQVSGLSGAIAVAAGMQHSLVVKSDGTVWDWGWNHYGQLGNGGTTDASTPVQVSGLSGIIAVAGGGQHSLALRFDGTVWAWGYNHDGELGNGGTTSVSTPVQVSGLSGITAVAAGIRHSLAVKSDGTVWAWGYNNAGQLGNGGTSSASSPVQVSGLSGAIAVAGGEYDSLALKSDGTVWAWGDNSDGELGNGGTTSTSSPVQVSGLSGAIAVAGGYTHSLALKSDGTVWAWGLNGAGQLGDGSTTMATVPVQVRGLSGVTVVAGGHYHSLALKSDGTVWAWGSAFRGELGSGSTTASGTPALVGGLSGVTAIAGGFEDSLALTAPAPSAITIPPYVTTVPSPGTVAFHGNSMYGDSGVAASVGGAIVHVLAGAWPMSGPVVYYRSLDGGATFAVPVVLAPPGQGGRYPAIAAGADGLVVAAWTMTTAPGTSVVLSRSLDYGTTWSVPSVLSSGSVWYNSLALATDGGSRIAVSWTDRAAQGIVLRVSLDGGATFGGGASIGVSSTSSHASLGFAQGTLVAAWQAQDGSIVTRRDSTGGDGAWAAPITLGRASSGSGASVSALGSTVVVAYTVGRVAKWRATVRVSGDRGAHWSPARAAPATTFGEWAEQVLLPRAGLLELYTGCHTGSVYNVCVRRSSDNGVTWGPRTRISAKSVESFVVAATRGSRSLVLYYSFQSDTSPSEPSEPTLILRRL